MQSSARILIVDDERVALRNLEHVMKKEGYEVTSTQSGANAITLLEEQRFDVVLTDLRMEKIDGMQILKKCRELYAETEVYHDHRIRDARIGRRGDEAWSFLLHC